MDRSEQLMSTSEGDLKQLATAQAKIRLQEFMDAKNILNLPTVCAPRLSILLVLYNRAELTLACLRSLQPRLEELQAEVVLVDNASRDETTALLDRVQGASILRNGENRGFPVAVNQAAEAATGTFLLLLNNDTEVLGDSLGAALRFLEANPDVGAVGGRIILLDGTLQEAGCTIWREGHVFQYGRGDSPSAPEYGFQRDVDYCSGAFLMTPRRLFHKLGGLDVSFSPGYFEDLDYCIRLWRSGWRVVYLPKVALIHFENASSTSEQQPLALYRRNHVFFSRKHADWLAWQCPSAETPRLWTRSSHDDRFKVLYLPSSGSPSYARTIGELRSRNYFVTVYPIDADKIVPPRELPHLSDDVEFLVGGNLDALPRFLAERRGYYDCIVASDAAIAERVKGCERRGNDAA
jgi:O-antigen biosynthesis protein